MIDGENRHIQAVNIVRRVDGHAVDNAVFAAVEDDSLDVRDRSQLRSGQIMGMNLAVNTQSTDFARDHRIFFAAEVKYKNDILLHENFLLFLYIENGSFNGKSIARAHQLCKEIFIKPLR